MTFKDLREALSDLFDDTAHAIQQTADSRALHLLARTQVLLRHTIEKLEEHHGNFPGTR